MFFGAVLHIPIGAAQAMADQQSGLTVIAEMIVGYMQG